MIGALAIITITTRAHGTEGTVATVATVAIVIEIDEVIAETDANPKVFRSRVRLRALQKIGKTNDVFTKQ